MTHLVAVPVPYCSEHQPAATACQATHPCNSPGSWAEGGGQCWALPLAVEASHGVSGLHSTAQQDDRLNQWHAAVQFGRALHSPHACEENRCNAVWGCTPEQVNAVHKLPPGQCLFRQAKHRTAALQGFYMCVCMLGCWRGVHLVHRHF